MSPNPEGGYRRAWSGEDVSHRVGDVHSGRLAVTTAAGVSDGGNNEGSTRASSPSDVAVTVGGHTCLPERNHGSEDPGESLSPVGRARRRLARFLELPKVHWAVLGLTLVDLALVMAALAAALLDPEGAESIYLTYVSIGILCVFNLELILRLVANGPNYFLCSALHLFDLLVVVTSLVLELIVHSTEGRALGGLVLILRLWRIIRIIETTISATHLEFKREQSKLERKIVMLKAEVSMLKRQLEESRRSP